MFHKIFTSYFGFNLGFESFFDFKMIKFHSSKVINFQSYS